MKRLFPILSIVTVILLAYALYLALVVAPTDALQGDVYRIIYYHVPSAWTAFLLFFINFVASVRFLARSKPSTERAAKWIAIAASAIGADAANAFDYPPDGLVLDLRYRSAHIDQAGYAPIDRDVHLGEGLLVNRH